MGFVWVIITNRVYDGDSLYGVFSSKDEADKALKSINDSDAEVVCVEINKILSTNS